MSSSTERFTGRVKWFNTKAGYGFITVTDGPKSGTDIFVHHSAIDTDLKQYVYLVQGEYVEFGLTAATEKNASHEFQASAVAGIKGGKLMCETRRDTRVARAQHRTEPATTTSATATTTSAAAPSTSTASLNSTSFNGAALKPKSVRPPSKKPSQAPATASNDGDWTYVSKARTGKPTSKPSATSARKPRNDTKH